MQRRWVVPAAMLTVATVAFPCGGSNSYDVDGPLVTTQTFAERALAPWDDFEVHPREEMKFLPGLLRVDSAKFVALIGRAPLQAYYYDTLPKARIPEPSSDGIEAAWARGDVDAAMRAARAVVDGILHLPASDDSARSEALRLAVETIEIGPVVRAEPVAARKAAFTRLAAPMRGAVLDSVPSILARQPASPRRASMEYAAFRLAMQRGIPDDSRDEILKQVPAARWDSLHAQQRAWLAAYPDHPYAPLVRFARLRLHFLASQPDSAWSDALTLYADYPVRAAAEMRYLLVTGVLPSERLLLDARVPAELRVALVGNVKPSRATWSAMMRMASERRASPWSENLEERLLGTLAADSIASATLPTDYPAWRATASPLWRYLWALNMLRAGRANDAVAFTRTPVTARQDPVLFDDAAMLAARIHMTRGDWVAAALVPSLDVWTRRYIVRALAPDSVAPLLVGAPDRDVAREARLVVAVRAAQRGEWEAAAGVVQPVDPARATRYRRLAVLARDTASDAGLLRFADALGAAGGQVFYETSRYFYRGMMNRSYVFMPDYANDAWDLPWTRATEQTRMHASLREGSERYLALKLYASYFARPGATAAAKRTAARRADRVYRALLNTDPSRSDSGFWVETLPTSAEARAIRGAARG